MKQTWRYHESIMIQRRLESIMIQRLERIMIQRLDSIMIQRLESIMIQRRLEIVSAVSERFSLTPNVINAREKYGISGLSRPYINVS